MGKIATLVVFGCVGLGAFVAAEVISVNSRPKTPQEIQVEIEKQAAEVRKTLPRSEGDLVTWFDIETRWQTMVYKYRIHAPRDLVVARKHDIESQLHGNPLLETAKAMMPKGVHLQAELYDGNNSFIYSLDMD